jgi:two-component system NtrC family response regulator
VPSVRERREDIPVLIHHLVKKTQKRFDRSVTFDDEVIKALQCHQWAGNVRELENVVERLVVFNQSGVVTKSDLPEHLGHTVKSFGNVLVHLPEEGFSLEELERDILREALELHSWNQSQTARYLTVTRNTLIYRMQKHNLKLMSVRGG